MDSIITAGSEEGQLAAAPCDRAQSAPRAPGFLKPQANECRTVVDVGGFWEFRRDPDRRGERSGWQNGFVREMEIAVPASWNEQRLELMHYFGVGWYQTRFHAPSSWASRAVVIHFGCAQFNARVWLNGILVGEHRGGSLPFAFSLRHALLVGSENRLVVEVDASIDPWALPPGRLETSSYFEGFNRSNPATAYDFFPYGGLPRPVVLQVHENEVRITDIRTQTYVDAAARCARVAVRVWIAGGQPGRVICRLAETTMIATAADTGWVDCVFELEHVRLWDVHDPHLYVLEVALLKDGKQVDIYCKELGLRSVSVADDQLLLNGRSIFLKGVGKHEDFAVVGRGLVAPLVVKDFDLLRWLGANSFRTSHYPYAEEWYEYADRHGILIIGETPLVGLNDRLFTPEVLARAKEVLREMIDRDRDHPSVIMWSVANEPTIRTEEGHAFFREMLSEARKLDGTRPVTYVAHEEPGDNLALAEADLVCVNKYFGWYERPGELEASRELLSACLERFREKFGKPILFAEFGADALPGLHTLPAEMFSEEYQAEILRVQIEVARSKPWVVGVHAWAFADFKVGQSVTRAVYNHKGVFTRDRQPKAGAFALKKLWDVDEPRRGKG